MRQSRRAAASAVIAFAIGLVVQLDPALWIATGPVPVAEAVIGRPATPGSVAGVSRRTTRRVIRRTTVYAATLPAGCSTVVVNGTQIYQCGATYYQPYGNQYVVVEVD